ncbi:MAG: molybdenum cofactor guanylyltransferase [Deinococcales bacterium]
MTRPPTDATQTPGPPVLEEVTGAVLCGGRSQRFGSDKALQVVGGRTLLARALDSLAPAGERLLVGRAYVGVDARHVPDLRPGLGPLAGLEAALHAAGGAWVALAACDLPCLSTAYWRLLCAQASGDRPVCVRHPNGDFEPLAALYPRSALRAVAARLDAGELDLQALLAALDARSLSAAEVESVCGPAVLRNVNRPQDLPAGDPCGV